MFELVLQSLFSGLLASGYYALIALGLALVFGTMRIINLAHGELVLLGAYIAYTAESQFGINPLFAIPLTIVIVCATSAAVYALVSRIHWDRELNSLILTFGVGIVLTNFVLIVWSPNIRSTSIAWFNEPILIGDTLFTTKSQLLFFVVGLLLATALLWWLTNTWHGRSLRAIASNRDAAVLMGVDPRTTEILAFVVAGMMAAVAGTAIYVVAVIQPELGHNLTIKAFIIAVLAGMGSIPGVMLGAVLIGITESLTVTLFSSALQELAGMLLFLIVLLVRPTGLFGGRGRVA